MITLEIMTETDVDDLMKKHYSNISKLGFESEEEYETFKHNVSMGLIKFGGSFASSLGCALSNADSDNSFLLISTFRELCEEHAKLHLVNR